MTCRTVQAARIYFDLIDNERNTQRNETWRNSDCFLLIEASLGMN